MFIIIIRPGFVRQRGLVQTPGDDEVHIVTTYVYIYIYTYCIESCRLVGKGLDSAVP